MLPAVCQKGLLHNQAMARLLVSQSGVVRRVATVAVAEHDGSISLTLVRNGENAGGWTWASGDEQAQTVAFSSPLPKSKEFTIHTSGRVNFKGGVNPGTIFIPCLLDLKLPVPVLSYIVPSVDALDVFGGNAAGSDNTVVNLHESVVGRVAFEFYAIPSTAESLSGEVWRFIVEGCYGLACSLVQADGFQMLEGAPTEAFTVVRPVSALPSQAVSEPEAYLRFQQLMHANQVRKALVASPIPTSEHEQVLAAVVSQGRGIQGPSTKGVWEIVCNVPMRDRPRLVVRFAEPHHQAEAIEYKSIDLRLQCVRVRFHVRDFRSGSLVKQPVEILDAFLDSEL